MDVLYKHLLSKELQCCHSFLILYLGIMCISTIPDQVILLRYSSHCWYGSNTINVTWHTLTSDYVVSLSKLFLTFAGNFAIKSDSNYNEFYNALKSPSLTPILTVSNHRSLLDDPLVLSSLIPWYMNIQPKYLRWALCAQEYCFQVSFMSDCDLDQRLLCIPPHPMQPQLVVKLFMCFNNPFMVARISYFARRV